MKRHIKGVHCRSAWSRGRGLMFSKKKTLIFHFQKPTRSSLHMFFVFFPIDVIALDQNKKVIEIKENLSPWNFFTGKKSASFLIEAPAGFIRREKIRLQDTILFK